MPTELTVHAVHQGGMRITAGNGRYSLAMDYPLKPGEEAQGLKPLEVLLASLAGCSGNALALLLNRSHQPFTGLEVTVRGLRRDEHPTAFTDITMDFTLRGKGLDSQIVQRSMAQSEEVLCPVWAMLKGSVKIQWSITLNEG